MPETFWGRIVMLLDEYSTSFLRGAGVTMVIALVGTFIGRGYCPDHSCF